MKTTIAALTLTLGLLFGATGPAYAQSPGAVLEGPTLEGRPFKLSSLRGKVVLVMFWSTSCAVCRDKMPELRQNYEGWKDKPFEMVLVNGDRRLQDLKDYEAIIARVVPKQQRFVQMWAGDAGFHDSLDTRGHLPHSFLIDKAGKVVERYQGRIPNEAWDRIAELL